MSANVPGDTPLPRDSTVAYQPAATQPGASSPDDVPQQIGRFEVRGVLGQGAFGRVYRARDPVLDREVALKVPRFGPDEHHLMERFLREAKAAARLRHPNIIAVFEIGQVGEQPFIATEYVEGQTLSARIAAARPSLRQAAEWVRSLALALHYAHEEGIIHRDIKPSNIMVDRRQRVQLMDFGLAKQLRTNAAIPLADVAIPTKSGSRPAVGGDPTMTVDGTLLGTPAYMAPEQARGELQAVGPHSDQYSLGVVLYELLTGELPLRGTFEEWRAHVTDPSRFPDPPQTRNPEVPPALAAICLRAMAKREAKRYRSLADLAIDLQHWLNDEPVSAWRPRKSLGPPWPRRLAAWCRKHYVATLAALAALILTAAVAGAFLWLNARVRNADLTIERSRQEAIGRESDLLRERGLRLRGTGQWDEALLCLAESLALASQSGDLPRQRAIAEAFDDNPELLDLPADLPDGHLWQLAGSLLFASKLRAMDVTELEARSQRLPHAGAARFTAFGGGGKTVLTADELPPFRDVGAGGPAPGLQFRDATTGQPFGRPLRADDKIVFSPDARRAVRMGSLVWSVCDLSSGESLGPQHPKDSSLKQALFNDDGSLLAVHWEEYSEPQTEIWGMQELRALRPRFTHPGFERWKPILRLSHDGQNLLSVQADANSSTLRVWRRGAKTTQPPELSLDCTAAAFHPDGEHLVLGTGRSLELRNLSLDAGRQWLSVAHCSELLFSPDGRWLLTLAQGRVQLWDMMLERSVGLPLKQLSGVTRIQFHPNGEQILTARDGVAQLWPHPLPAADRPTAVRLWAQAVTGLQRTAEGASRALIESELDALRGRFAH